MIAGDYLGVEGPAQAQIPIRVLDVRLEGGAKSCPVGAISGQRKVAHVIDQDRCIQCGACREVCPFDAVGTEGRMEVAS